MDVKSKSFSNILHRICVVFQTFDSSRIFICRLLFPKYLLAFRLTMKQFGILALYVSSALVSGEKFSDNVLIIKHQ